MPLPPPETMTSNLRRSTPGYGPYDTHRLNPGRLSQPLPETVELLLDERSHDLGEFFEDVPNIDVTRTRLPVGDVCAVHGDSALLFVLTTAHEVGEAMDDGRLTKLVRDLGRTAHPACVIIEGGLYLERRQPLPRLSALHARLTFGVNVPVIETIDRRHTIYMVVCCARDRFFSEIARTRFDPRPAALPHVASQDVARYMLELIPGVSPGRAGALLDRFGSLSSIAKATQRDLAETDGIGKVTAGRILAILSATGNDGVAVAASHGRRLRWGPVRSF